MRRPPPLLIDYEHRPKPISDLGAAAITIVDALIVLGLVGILGGGSVVVLERLPLDIAVWVIGALVVAVVAFCIWSAVRLR